MGLDSLERGLRSLLKGEHSSLTISFNDHACNYCSVREALEETGMLDHGDWVSEDERQRAIETNSVWTIQWYPHTPVGFCALNASSLDAVVNAALATVEPERAPG